MTNNQKLQINIRKLREKNGSSQEKLARLADGTNNTIIKIESEENQNPTLKAPQKSPRHWTVTINDLVK